MKAYLATIVVLCVLTVFGCDSKAPEEKSVHVEARPFTYKMYLEDQKAQRDEWEKAAHDGSAEHVVLLLKHGETATVLHLPLPADWSNSDAVYHGIPIKDVALWQVCMIQSPDNPAFKPMIERLLRTDYPAPSIRTSLILHQLQHTNDISLKRQSSLRDELAQQYTAVFEYVQSLDPLAQARFYQDYAFGGFDYLHNHEGYKEQALEHLRLASREAADVNYQLIKDNDFGNDALDNAKDLYQKNLDSLVRTYPGEPAVNAKQIEDFNHALKRFVDCSTQYAGEQGISQAVSYMVRFHMKAMGDYNGAVKQSLSFIPELKSIARDNKNAMSLFTLTQNEIKLARNLKGDGPEAPLNDDDLIKFQEVADYAKSIGQDSVAESIKYYIDRKDLGI